MVGRKTFAFNRTRQGPQNLDMNERPSGGGVPRIKLSSPDFEGVGREENEEGSGIRDRDMAINEEWKETPLGQGQLMR